MTDPEVQKIILSDLRDIKSDVKDIRKDLNSFKVRVVGFVSAIIAGAKVIEMIITRS